MLKILKASQLANMLFSRCGDNTFTIKQTRKMASENLAVVLHGIEDLRVEQRPIEEIADHEVLLEMDTVGICGTDVHFFTHGHIGDIKVTKPMVIGHEASGIVDKVGKNVKNLKKGDRVAIEQGVPCRICDYCKTGRYNLCQKLMFAGLPPNHGSLQRYFRHAADFCHKLPDHVSMDEGALLEPLAVGVHACRRGNVGLGSNVLILGAGPIGLTALLTARSMGAAKIMVIDVQEHRVKLAKELCATHTLVIKPDEKPEDVAKKVEKMMCVQPDKTIDCCCNEATVRLAIYATRSGGCCILVGLSSNETKLPIINALSREVDLIGAFIYNNDYPIALSLVASGKVKEVNRLITHHYDITEAAEAFTTVRYGCDNAIKVLIHAKPRS